jgi:hypothetical protein
MAEPRKKRSTRRCVLAADPSHQIAAFFNLPEDVLANQLVGRLPDFGEMDALGQIVAVTTRRKSKRSRLLVAAIEKRLAHGQRPPDDVLWKQFCDDIRDDCGAWRGDRKHRTPKRGFSDDTIERVARELMKSSKCQD